MINGMVYVALRAFINATTDMTVTYHSSKSTLNIKGKNFEMDVIDGSNVIYANGRTLFSMTPSVIMTNGRMYAPLHNIAKALGLSYKWDAFNYKAILTGGITPITHGSVYYAEDAVYWLSRIISAESRGESLLGQIAVGSVVMNRVKSSLYPNTIWGVIFDRKYGVQFSPILDGSIYSAPTASSLVAAKICLEGFNVNTEALFFLYPRYSTSSWIPSNREYLFSIGKHDFYA
jgi:N-acetylmuramoyl-L-alanine amidase